MNLSIDVNYYINQIELSEDKELLQNYYNNLQKHILICQSYIKVKNELYNIIIDYQIIKNTKNIKNIDIDADLTNDKKNIDIDSNITYSIEEIKKMKELIITDMNNYKKLFKKQLFLLIKK